MLDLSDYTDSGNLFDGHYKLLKPLSCDGGTADVWLAIDTNTIDVSVDDFEEDTSSRDTGMLVAIKIYRPKNALDVEGEQRFRDEFKIVYECRHENLLQPTSFSIYNGIPYLVLPYCKNGSSEQLIGKQLSSDDIWKFILDVSSGLNRLHTNGTPIIHQDIKPANILIDNNGDYAITDFGISSRRNVKYGYYYEEEHSGTMAYMAPERFRDSAEPMSQSDIWAFGATLYEILSGKVPFGEEGGKSQLENPDQIMPVAGIPSDVQRLISDCLAVEPGNRPSARAIKEAANIKRYPVTPHKNHFWLLGIGLVVVIVIAVALFLLFPQSKQSESNFISVNKGDSINEDSLPQHPQQKVHDTIYIGQEKEQAGIYNTNETNDNGPNINATGKNKKQLADGVYKQTRYQPEGMSMQDNPFEVYKIVKAGKVLQMDFIRYNPLQYCFTPVHIDYNDVIENTQSTFDYRWVCDMRNHKTIAYGTPVREHYDTKFRDVVNLPRLFKALSGNVSALDHPLKGVWKDRESNAGNEYYKVYTSEFCYVIHLRRSHGGTHAIQEVTGWQLPVKYLNDEDTIENGDACHVKWNGSASFCLTYVSRGKSFTEYWEKAQLPSDFVHWFK